VFIEAEQRARCSCPLEFRRGGHMIRKCEVLAACPRFCNSILDSSVTPEVKWCWSFGSQPPIRVWFAWRFVNRNRNITSHIIFHSSNTNLAFDARSRVPFKGQTRITNQNRLVYDVGCGNTQIWIADVKSNSLSSGRMPVFSPLYDERGGSSRC